MEVVLYGHRRNDIVSMLKPRVFLRDVVIMTDSRAELIISFAKLGITLCDLILLLGVKFVPNFIALLLGII